MAHLDPIVTASARNRSLVDGEDHGFPLAQRNHLASRLHARTLLDDHELAAGEIGPGRREQDRNLDREDGRAIEILVQAVVVADVVLQQQRRRSGLASGGQCARNSS